MSFAPPLTPLKLQLGLLARALPDAEAAAPLHRRARRAEAQVDRLAELVDQLLEVSELDRLELDKRSVDVAALLREIVDRRREQAARARISLGLDAPAELFARVDPKHLRDALNHLISNAVKFGAGAPVQISLRTEGDLLAIDVEDRGIGLDPPDYERIFQRFERAAPIDKYAGLGLGLYVVRRVVQAHGGRVIVASEPGRGTRFTVLLPLENEEA